MRRLVIGLMLVLTMFSCQNNYEDDDKVVATIYDKVLHQSDLQGVVYEGVSRSDSIVRTKAFIDSWIRQQLLLHQAEVSLKKSDIDFSKQIEDYRNTLIIFKYESQYIENNLDTVISETEISKYIEENDSAPGLDRESIRYIILNMRKNALIEKMNNSLYNKAVKDNVFVIY